MRARGPRLGGVTRAGWGLLVADDEVVVQTGDTGR
jgi:hypothetical protein